MDNLMILGAEYVIYLTIIFMFALALKKGPAEKKALVLAIFAIPAAIILIKFIHLFILTPRPLASYEDSVAFPSRHTSLMATFFFAYFIFRSKWSFVFLFLMIWVGVSRVYVGVHFPIDILGGIGVGFLSAFFTKIILKSFQKRFFL